MIAVRGRRGTPPSLQAPVLEEGGQLGRSWLAHLASQPENVSLATGRDGPGRKPSHRDTVAYTPFFDPGPMATIDDFCIAEPSFGLSVGSASLTKARELLCAKGFSQIVVFGSNDTEKSTVLDETRLSLTSTWWTANPSLTAICPQLHLDANLERRNILPSVRTNFVQYDNYI